MSIHLLYFKSNTSQKTENSRTLTENSNLSVESVEFKNEYRRNIWPPTNSRYSQLTNYQKNNQPIPMQIISGHKNLHVWILVNVTTVSIHIFVVYCLIALIRTRVILYHIECLHGKQYQNVICATDSRIVRPTEGFANEMSHSDNRPCVARAPPHRIVQNSTETLEHGELRHFALVIYGLLTFSNCSLCGYLCVRVCVSLSVCVFLRCVADNHVIYSPWVYHH